MAPNRRLSDRFADEAAKCASLPELRSLVADATFELGFSFFALLEHGDDQPAQARRVRIDNYPAEWTEEWEAIGAQADDPVHLASRRCNSGFGWCELEELVHLSGRQKRILARARKFGVGAGFTVPANVRGEPSASCSFAVARRDELPLARLQCTELVGAHALRAVRRLRPLARRGPCPRLSRRELQCLRLVALGKTDWEIGKILGISVETVHQYVKHARAQYDVVSRTQLVVLGLRDAWLSFEDAIPPDG